MLFIREVLKVKRTNEDNLLSKQINTLAGTVNRVVGLDVGRSGVKLAFTIGKEVKTKFFPSVVKPHHAITFDQNPRMTEEDTVEVDGQKYFVGDTAIIQGATRSVGLANNWLDGIEHKALLIRAKKYLSSYGIVEPSLIVVGLPVSTFRSDATKLADQVKQIFVGSKTIPVPQPYGVYQNEILTDDGKFSGQATAQGQYAVIDFGHYSTDYMYMNGATWVENSSGSSEGMYLAVETLVKNLSGEGITINHLEAQDIIRERRMKDMGEYRDMSNEVQTALMATVKPILQNANNYFGEKARMLDKIIVAGGGGGLIYPNLKQKWKQTVLPDDPRFAVALGMRKFGVKSIHENPKAFGVAEK